MAYSVVFTRKAERQLSKLSQAIKIRIVAALDGLVENPRHPGTKKLTNEDSYRLRVGNYRVIYNIKDDQLVVLVLRVGHRREVYD